jgi:putative ABC transport system permease protein
LGTDPKTFLQVHPDYKIAADEAGNWERDPAGAIVDRDLAAKYHWKVGNRLFLKGSTVPVNLELSVRGIFDAPVPTQAVIFNWEYVEQAERSISGRNNLYLILTDSPESASRVPTKVDALFHNSTEPTRTETEKQFELEFLEMLGNVKAFLLGICMAALFTTALVSTNTMAMSTRERTRELGVLRALGFNRRRIVGLCIAESVALSTAGSFVAGLASYCLLFVTKPSSEWRLYSAVLKITPLSLLILVVSAVVIGTLSAVVPSYRAALMPIASALRHIE